MVRAKRCIIAEIIKELELTQTQIAQETGVKQSAISRYCKGASENYNISYLFALAEYFGSKMDRINTIEDLFEDIPSEDNH